MSSIKCEHNWEYATILSNRHKNTYICLTAFSPSREKSPGKLHKSPKATLVQRQELLIVSNELLIVWFHCICFKQNFLF